MTELFRGLARAAENAREPDRELDCRVWSALTGMESHEWHAPYYTRSLDMALKLIPDGFRVTMGNRFDGTGYASLYRGLSKDGEIKGDAVGGMVMAVIAAALRARGKMTEVAMRAKEASDA